MSNPASNLVETSRPISGRRPRSSARPTSGGRQAWNTAQLTREESRDLEAFGASDQFEIVDDSEAVIVPEQKGCLVSCLRGLRGKCLYFSFSRDSLLPSSLKAHILFEVSTASDWFAMTVCRHCQTLAEFAVTDQKNSPL